MQWTIEAKVLPITHFGGHLYLEIFDNRGRRITQINGFAVNRDTGKPRYTGSPNDQLKGFISQEHVLRHTHKTMRHDHPHDGYVIFRGSEEDIKKAIAKAEEIIEHINNKNYSYKLLYFNSNSVFTSVVEAMSDVIKIDRIALKKAIAIQKITPGVKHKSIINDNHIWGSKGTRAIKFMPHLETAFKKALSKRVLSNKPPAPEPEPNSKNAEKKKGDQNNDRPKIPKHKSHK